MGAAQLVAKLNRVLARRAGLKHRTASEAQLPQVSAPMFAALRASGLTLTFKGS